MADLADIREGLRANLAAITGCQVSAYMLDNPTPPTLQVMGPDEAEGTTFGRGGETIAMVVQGFVGLVSDIGAQKRLDKWWATSGAESVTVAIEADKTLGGAADDLVVLRKGGYRIYDLPNQTRVLGAEWTVRVETS